MVISCTMHMAVQCTWAAPRYMRAVRYTYHDPFPPPHTHLKVRCDAAEHDDCRQRQLPPHTHRATAGPVIHTSYKP